MRLLQKTTKANEEIEIDFCFHWDYWALPFCVYWWRSKKISKLLGASIDIGIHFLCFSLHFTYWGWK